MHYDWLFAIVALVLFTVRFIWSSYIDDVLIGIIHAVITWMFAFGITGFSFAMEAIILCACAISPILPIGYF